MRKKIIYLMGCNSRSGNNVNINAMKSEDRDVTLSDLDRISNKEETKSKANLKNLDLIWFYRSVEPKY